MRLTVLLLSIAFLSTSVDARNYLSSFCDVTNKTCSKSEFINALKSTKNDILQVDIDNVVINLNVGLHDANDIAKDWYNTLLEGKNGNDIYTIKTDGLQFYGMNALGFRNLIITAFDPNKTPNGALVQFGGANTNSPTKNITLENVTISEAPRNLLYVYNVDNFKLIDSTLKNAGRKALTTGSGDGKRHLGHGLESHYVRNMRIENTDFISIPHVGIGIWSSNQELVNRDTNSDVVIFNNRLHLETPYSVIPGKQAHVGIYVGQTLQNKRFNISSNIFTGVRDHAARLNGSDIKFEDNQIFNKQYESCSSGNAAKGNAVGVIGFLLKNSTIKNNCIKNISTGIHLRSWGVMKDNLVTLNSIKNVDYGIEYLVAGNTGQGQTQSGDRFFEFDNSGFLIREAQHVSPLFGINQSLSLTYASNRQHQISDNTISDNTITGYSQIAVCLMCRLNHAGQTDIGIGNTIYRNTIRNYNEDNALASISMHFQDDLNFSYNWLRARSESPALEVKNITNSVIKKSTLSNTSDINFPATRLGGGTSGISFENLDICGFNSAPIGLGNNQTNLNIYTMLNCPS